MLEELGIPIVAERGRFGGYALVAGFKLPPLVFTNDEALALSVGLLAARSLGLADAAPAVAGAQAKLQRVMPQALKRRLRAIDETVALDLSRRSVCARGQRRAGHAQHRGAGPPARAPALPQPARTRTRRATSIPMASSGAAGAGTPSGTATCAATCARSGSTAWSTCAPLPASFGRPEGFDALAHLARSVATLPRAHAIEVLLHTDLERARRETFDAIGMFTPEGDAVRLSAQADDLDWFARELSRLSFDFSVLAPPALRAAVKRQSARLERLAETSFRT